MRNLRTHYFKKGQALIELAVFGSLLILCLGFLIKIGLSMNYQQELEMETFRKTQYLARNIDAGGYYRNQGSAQLVTIADKPMPDPGDKFGLSPRTSFGSSASVSWSNMLLANIDYLEEGDLPKIHYYIKGASGSHPADLEDGNYVYTTAKFRSVSGDYLEVFKRKVYNKQGVWRWVTVKNDTGLCGDIQDRSKMHLDVDHDGKEEQILSIVKAFKQVQVGVNEETGDPIYENKEYVGTFKVLDYQEGEIDLTIDDLEVAQGEKIQGLQPGFKKESSAGVSLKRSETPSEIINETTFDADETYEAITRTIRTKQVDEDIESRFYKDGEWKWETPYE